MNLGDEPLRLPGAGVTADLFDVLGVRPALGRGFTAEEMLTDGPGIVGGTYWRTYGVVILSDGAWRSYFAADPAAIGRTLVIEGLPHTVVGVMPPTSTFPTAATTFWFPHNLDPGGYWGGNVATMIGRLRDGYGTAEAQAELRTLSASFRELLPWARFLPADKVYGAEFEVRLLVRRHRRPGAPGVVAVARGHRRRVARRLRERGQSVARARYGARARARDARRAWAPDDGDSCASSSSRTSRSPWSRVRSAHWLSFATLQLVRRAVARRPAALARDPCRPAGARVRARRVARDGRRVRPAAGAARDARRSGARRARHGCRVDRCRREPPDARPSRRRARIRRRARRGGDVVDSELAESGGRRSGISNGAARRRARRAARIRRPERRRATAVHQPSCSSGSTAPRASSLPRSRARYPSTSGCSAPGSTIEGGSHGLHADVSRRERRIHADDGHGGARRPAVHGGGPFRHAARRCS